VVVAAVVIPVTMACSKQKSTMRLLPLIPALCLAALLAACSTPDSRISGNQAAFDRFPADVQQKLRAGQIEIGYTQEMVRIALGEPARQFTHKSEQGDSDLWVYHDEGPRFSFGVGVGSGGRHSGVGGGLAMSTGGYDPDEKMRVEFREGKVSAIEIAKR
jgi:hypothetical protein